MYRNLLPIEFRKRLLFRQIVRRWLVVAAWVVLPMLLGGLVRYYQVCAEETHLEQLNATAEPLRKLTRSNNLLKGELEILTSKEAGITNKSNSELHLQMLGVISQYASSVGENIQVVNYKLEETTVTAKKKTAPKRNNKAGTEAVSRMRLNLQGVAIDDASIASFVKLLERNEAFESVELKSINRTEIPQGTIRSYQIECYF